VTGIDRSSVVSVRQSSSHQLILVPTVNPLAEATSRVFLLPCASLIVMRVPLMATTVAISALGEGLRVTGPVCASLELAKSTTSPMTTAVVILGLTIAPI